MAQTLVKGKLRQIVNKVYKSSDYICPFPGMVDLPVRVTNVRMYVDDTMHQDWSNKYSFEIDLEITIPTYDKSPGCFRYGGDRYVISMLRRRLAYNGLLPSFVNKASMFTAQRDNYIKVKKISIIRNNTPPSL